MRTFPVALLLALAPVASATPAAPSGPPFRSEAGGYSIRLPAAPRESVKDKNGVTLHYAVAAAPDGSASVVLAWGDYFPEAELAKGRVFDDELKALSRGGARIERQRPVRIAGFEGREYEGALQDGKPLRGRIVIRDARVYMLMAIARDAGGIAAAEACLKSLAFDGPGIPDPPRLPAARRVAFPEAGVSLELHGDPERSGGAGGAKESRMLAASSRGGFRMEIANYEPSPARTERDHARVLDGYVQGFGKVKPVLDARTLVAAGRPARQFRTQVADGYAVVRAVHLDRGVLTLQIVGRGMLVDDREANAFFDSVRMVTPGAGR